MDKIGDLLECFQLYAVCSDCQRMERVELAPLIAVWGADTEIDRVRRRLRCAGCRQRTGDIRIVYVGKDAAVSGFHYRGSPTRAESKGA